MYTKKTLILGGIGSGSTIAMSIKDAESKKKTDISVAGFINDKDGLKEICGYPVVGGLKEIPRFIEEGYYFINTIYKIDGQVHRINLFESLNIPMANLATFVHYSSYIAEDVHLSPGTVVLANSNISSGARLGKCTRVMTGSMIGHDTEAKDHSFFAACSCIGSHITAGIGSYFGLNCTVNGKLEIGEYAVVGSGSVVTRNIAKGQIWAGNPAKYLRDVKDFITA